ncbi:MAG: substrate-binding domain-containing protein [Chloroflexota bacterium]|nr:substrate-binding domain-containing protein [Chloroflexota bacterium]
MKKRLLSILVVLLIGALIVSCAPTAEVPTEEPVVDEPAGDEAMEEEPVAEDTGDLVFAHVVKSIGDTWFVRYEEGVKQFGEDFGVTAFMEGPSQPDSAQQVAVINDLIAQGVDVLVNVPYGVPENETAQKKAMDDGTVVIGHEALTAQGDTLDYDLEAYDSCAAGEEFMRELAAGMGEEGQYVQFVGSLTNATHNIYMECGKAFQEANYPDMEFVGKYESNESSENGYNIMKDILKTYPEVKGVQSGDSVEVQGIGRAVDEAGLQDEITVVGVFIVSDTRELLESGALDVSILWDPADAAYAASVVAMKILNDEEITEGMDLGVPGYESIMIEEGENGAKVIFGSAFLKITKDNMDDNDF